MDTTQNRHNQDAADADDALLAALFSSAEEEAEYLARDEAATRQRIAHATEQIVFHCDGYYMARECEGAAAFEMVQSGSRWVYPKFEGQAAVWDYSGYNFGIAVVECSEEFFNALNPTDADGDLIDDAVGYATTCGRYFVDADGEHAALAATLFKNARRIGG